MQYCAYYATCAHVHVHVRNTANPLKLSHGILTRYIPFMAQKYIECHIVYYCSTIVEQSSLANNMQRFGPKTTHFERQVQHSTTWFCLSCCTCLSKCVPEEDLRTENVAIK